MSKLNEKKIYTEWETLKKSIYDSTGIDLFETPAKKHVRILLLEKDPEAWFEYYFPRFCFAKPAKFHITSSRKYIYSERIVHSRKWARGLSKSTRRMLEIFFKVFAQKIRANLLMISKSEDNAVRLLAPYKANLESNQRLIHDYGTQHNNAGRWTAEEFITKKGSSFRAVGAGQNPRGARLDEMRINFIVFDDIDDDEVCRNEDRLEVRWKWIQEAVIPTIEISKPYWISCDNNIIAENSIATKFAELATLDETVNIRDESGRSTWIEKNSEEDIDAALDLMSYESGQKEYFNNPFSQGKTFPELTYGKCPPLSSIPFVVIYADPSPSNKDKPTLKSAKNNSCKAVVIVGCHGLHRYIYKAFVNHVKNADFIDWLFTAHQYAVKAKQQFIYVENNTLQDPFYQQVLKPLIADKSKAIGVLLPVSPDDRKKPDKFVRIEGTLEPLNRNGYLILNEQEKNDPHMKRLEAQFKSVKPNSKTMDGPDAVEGAVFKIDEKVKSHNTGHLHIKPRSINNKKRF